MEMTQTSPRSLLRDTTPARVVNVLREINVASFLDRWGPAQVLQVYDPVTHMHGILVIDNTMLGPGCGGLRIMPTITPLEVFRHARAMTYTNALAGVNFGGAAAAIRADPELLDIDVAIRSFATEIAPFIPSQYIAAPGIHVGADEIALFVDTIVDRRGGVGKPTRMGGIPHERGIIGFGIGVILSALLDAVPEGADLPSSLASARIAVEGNGLIARTVAKYVASQGATVVAACNDYEALYNPAGIALERVNAFLAPGRKEQSCITLQEGDELVSRRAFTTLPTDIAVTTLGQNLYTDATAANCGCRCLIEGLNHPVTPMGEQYLREYGVILVPEMLVNVSAALAAYAEYHDQPVELAFSKIESVLRTLTTTVVEEMYRTGVPLKRLLLEHAQEHLLRAMEPTPAGVH